MKFTDDFGVEPPCQEAGSLFEAAIRGLYNARGEAREAQGMAEVLRKKSGPGGEEAKARKLLSGESKK